MGEITKITTREEAIKLTKHANGALDLPTQTSIGIPTLQAVIFSFTTRMGSVAQVIRCSFPIKIATSDLR